MTIGARHKTNIPLEREKLVAPTITLKGECSQIQTFTILILSIADSKQSGCDYAQAAS